MVHWLAVEAVHHAVRQDLSLRQDYQRLKFRRGHAVAKVAVAQVGRAYVLDVAEWSRLPAAGSHARQPGGHPIERKFIARLIGRLASTSDRGVGRENHGRHQETK